MPDLNKFNKRIEEIEATIGKVVPLIATTGSVVRLLGGLVRGKMSPDQQKAFDQAVGELDAQNAKLQTAIDQLRAASGGTTAPSGTLDGPESTTSKSTAAGPEGHSGG